MKLYFIFSSIFSILMALSAQAQNLQCDGYFNPENVVLSYESYKETKPSPARVQVVDFKGNTKEFLIGRSAYEYYVPAERKATTELLSIFQNRKSHKIYLIIRENRFTGRSSTIVVEHNLIAKNSRVIANMSGDLSNITMTVPWQKDYVILTADRMYTHTFRRHIARDRLSSYLIPLAPPSNPESIFSPKSYFHSVDILGTEPVARKDIKQYRRPPAVIREVRIQSRRLVAQQVVWSEDGVHVLQVLGQGLRILKLNFESDQLEIEKTYSLNDLRGREATQEIRALFGPFQIFN